jgi:EAL domain-containing protein (putative c-di-GMP-specific phosphodiesterase class I)
MFMEEPGPLIDSLGKLRRLGVTVAVDDFGTGYSSLSYLKRLPVDTIKIDRSFIRELPDNAEDAAINRAVVELVHRLQRKVIAEGVETRRQLQFLRENGCDEVQGFYISQALSAEQFQALLEKNPVLDMV